MSLSVNLDRLDSGSMDVRNIFSTLEGDILLVFGFN